MLPNKFAPKPAVARLPSSNLKQLMPELELIRCEREQILVDVDSSLEHVFYPDSGVVSAVAVYSDGRVIETATIGREGCTNVQAAFRPEMAFEACVPELRKVLDRLRGLGNSRHPRNCGSDSVELGLKRGPGS